MNFKFSNLLAASLLITGLITSVPDPTRAGAVRNNTPNSATENFDSDLAPTRGGSIRTGRKTPTSTRKKNPTASTDKPTSSPPTPGGYPNININVGNITGSPSAPGGYPTGPTGYPPSTNMNPSVLFTSNPSQPVSPIISAQINAALAAKGLTLASCSANPGVVVTMGSYMACAYPTDLYSPGRYSLAF